MKISAYLLSLLLLFVVLAGCQSQSQPLNSPGQKHDRQNVKKHVPVTEKPPEKNDNSEFSLNTEKVDQMIAAGKKPEETLEELNKLEKDIKNDRQRGTFFVRRAEIFINMGDNQKAVTEFKKVDSIKAAPVTRLLAYSYIASINNNMGNKKEVELYLNKARKIYPEVKDEDNNPRILIYFVSSALINSDRGNFEEVIKDLNAANALIKKYHLTNYENKESIIMEKAFAYAMLKQPERALKTIKNFKVGTTLHLPQNKDLDDLEIRYKVYIAKGEYENALKCTDQLKDENGFSIPIAKGNVYYVWGKNEEARKEYELVLKNEKDPWLKEQASKMLEKLK